MSEKVKEEKVETKTKTNNNIENNIVPNVLNNKWIIEALLALALVPIEDSNAVVQEPMFEPKIMNKTLLPPSPICKPWATIEIIIVVTAEELWTKAVNPIPISKSIIGLLMLCNALKIASFSLNPLIALDMDFSPKKTSPKPKPVDLPKRWANSIFILNKI